MFGRLANISHQLFADIEEIPPLLRPQYLPGFDGLRAISIVIVILSHVFIGSAYGNTFIGSAGVDIFFVISGFLITSLLLKEKVSTGKISLRNFYLRRAFRILPVAYLFILVVVILNSWLNLQIKAGSFFSAIFFVKNLPVNFNGYTWYLQHYWTLSVEEQFYLTFPFLLAFSLNGYIRVIICLVLAVPVIEWLGYNKIGVFYTNHWVHTAAFIIINLLGYTVSILVGSLFSILVFKKIIVFDDNRFNRWLSLILFALAILIRTNSSCLYLPYAQLLFFPVLIALVLVLNLNPNSLFSRLLHHRVLVYLGVLSYSLYIWQQLFDNAANWMISSGSLWLHLAVLFAVANISYYFYERPLLVFKRRFGRVG
jgi:peptidoglycan/LPS O-acetylase OafA/YrhL